MWLYLYAIVPEVLKTGLSNHQLRLEHDLLETPIWRLDPLQQQFCGLSSHFVARLGDCGDARLEDIQPLRIVGAHNLYILGAAEPAYLQGFQNTRHHQEVCGEDGRGRVAAYAGRMAHYKNNIFYYR